MASAFPATEFIWNVDMEVNLFHAMRGHKPAGVNKHFQMIAIHEKLSSASKKITSEDVWHRLSTLYDLRALNDSEILPFPNKNIDFILPELGTPASLTDQTFPRSNFVNLIESEATKSEGKKSEASTKTAALKSTPSKPDNTKIASSTPVSSNKSSSSKHDNKSSSSSKSNNQKNSSSSETPKTSHIYHSQNSHTSDSQQRTKRKRGPSSSASPATPSESAAKRRR